MGGEGDRRHLLRARQTEQHTSVSVSCNPSAPVVRPCVSLKEEDETGLPGWEAAAGVGYALNRGTAHLHGRLPGLARLQLSGCCGLRT